MSRARFLVVGAGPAGLAAAYDLALRGHAPVVLEKGPRPGGLSKTVVRGRFRFDVGGHRFFTKNRDVNRLWRTLLGADLLRRKRLSRVYYRGRLFSYPLRPFESLAGLGLRTSLRVLGGFLARRLFPRRPETSFADWVSNRFGDELFSIFFRTYTEKVWGVPCSRLSADWAAQRIRNLDLGRAVLRAFGIGRERGVASLIEEFDYPRLGPGQMYERLAEVARLEGARIELEAEAVGLVHSEGRVTAVRVDTARGSRKGGREIEREMGTDGVISTMPITDLVCALEPAAPREILEAARSLRYRSLVTVNLVLRAEEVLPDTWIYIHEPGVRASRLQLYKNWSPAMSPDEGLSPVGLEYFAFEGDGVWSLPDEELIELAKEDLVRLGVAAGGGPSGVLDAFVVRSAKAYPVYEIGYRGGLDAIRRYLATFSNLVCAGRYGQFRYNNMDHAIVTGWLAARRLTGEPVDPWAVNEEAEYLEEGSSPGSRR